MDNLKNQIYDNVEKWYGQRVGITRMQEYLFKSLNQEVPKELIYEIINEIKQCKKQIQENDTIIDDAKMDLLQTKQAEKEDGGLQEIADSDNEELKYDVSDRHYIFYKGDKPYKVLISTVRAIFEAYSSKGQNLSGEEIRQRFKLPPGIFELIKNATGLYKSSYVDDPVTLSRLDHEGLEEYIENKTERILEDKYVSVYERAVKNKQKRDLDKFAKANRGYDIFMEKLMEAIKSYNPIDMDGIEIPKIANNKTKDIFITDAHFGKKGTDGIVIRFKKLTQDLLDSEEKNINITFGGDLGELFVPYGEMHVGQRLGTENIETSDLIMLIVDVFEQMLLKLYKNGKKVTFNGMGGNHDRFTDKKEFDPFRTPAMVIYKFLQKIVENTNIKINILKDKVNIIKSGNVKYIFLHGDGLSEKELTRRALNEMEDGYYLVIVSGDKHHYKMSELSDRILRIQSPALAGPGKYDIDLGLSSLPGAVEFVKNNDGLIDITVKRYK